MSKPAHILQVVPQTAVTRHLNYYTPTNYDRRYTPVQVKDLKVGGQLALWSMRKWVQIRHKDQSVSERLLGPYAQAGISTAIDSFDESMLLLSKLAMRTVTFECTCSAVLNADEVRIIGALALLQKSELEAAKHNIGRILVGKLSDVYCRSANAYTDALRRAGLFNHLPSKHENFLRSAKKEL